MSGFIARIKSLFLFPGRKTVSFGLGREPPVGPSLVLDSTIASESVGLQMALVRQAVVETAVADGFQIGTQVCSDELGLEADTLSGLSLSVDVRTSVEDESLVSPGVGLVTRVR
jgi:hypothetical protein